MRELALEHRRLGEPLNQLQYNGTQAREHVARLFGTDVLETAIAGEGADDGDDGPHAIAAIEDEPTAVTANASYEAKFIAGQWQLVLLGPDGQPESQVPLPALDPNGDGFFQVLYMEDGTAVVSQGGSVTPELCSDFFPTGHGAGGSSGVTSIVPYTPEPMLGEMRLPVEDFLSLSIHYYKSPKLSPEPCL